MTLQAVPPTGPFRGALSFDESGSSVFFGRDRDLEALFAQIGPGGNRIAVLTGEAGVGKTSLLRAGVLPALASQGVLAFYVGGYDDIEQELVQSASRVRADPPAAGESAVEYAARLARSSPTGAVLLLDHLETIVRDDASEHQRSDLSEFLRQLLGAGGDSLRLLFSIESSHFHKLGRLLPRSFLAAAGGSYELARFDEEQTAAVVEQTALQTGTFIEAGLAAELAADLCRKGPCLPLDLQLVARAMMDQRLTSIRRYRRSGGANALIVDFFERIVREAGGRPALKVLIEMLDDGPFTVDELTERTRQPRPAVEQAVATFLARGVTGRREADRHGSGKNAERIGLIHPALGRHARAFCALEKARAERTRRALSRRVLGGGRLSLIELFSVRRHLGGSLTPDEQNVVRRSVRRKVFHVSLAGLIACAIFVVVFFDLRSSYTLDYDPHGDVARARVVVRMGRPGRSWLSLLPHKPAFGSVLADTGFHAAGLSPDLAGRIESGRASGKLERARAPAVPGWLRSVLTGLRPVQRGTAAVLLGEPTGVRALQQAFSDPLSRRETLDVLEIVGQGGAGEDEILAAALADASPEIRRRGVEVAAAIDRRRGTGAHAATLRRALADKAPSVREAVLRASATLPTTEAADILRVALAGNDLPMRRQAEQAITALAERDPQAAAAAALAGAKSSDAVRRREGMLLLSTIAERSPEALADTLALLVADEDTHEDSRVQALRLLRKAGIAPRDLAAVIEKAVAPTASPRLRSAALPLHAQVIDPAAAEELALSEWRGPALARAAAAAVWGTLAESRPDSASKALRAALFDPAAEVRAEAARALGHLRRDGLKLVGNALLDPSPEVQQAAIDSAVMLAEVNAYAAAEALGKASRLVRPATRPAVVEALGRVGAKKPQVVLQPLVRAFKEGNPATRDQVARTLCQLARVDSDAVSPYLRLAARDPDRDVRGAAASCMETLAAGDPRGATRIAAELAGAAEASVRMAAAAALGQLVERAGDSALPALTQLLADGDRGTRTVAIKALMRFGDAGHKLGKHAADVERTLSLLLEKGDRDERVLAVQAAASTHLGPLLRQAASEPDEAVRLEALRGAAKLAPPDLDLLRAAADSESPAVRGEAIRLLVSASGGAVAEVLPIFEAMVRSPDLEARTSAAAALGGLVGGERAAVSLLADLLQQRSEAVRRAAARALGDIAERQAKMALPLLERALEDGAHDVRVAAGRGLAIAWAAQQSPEALARILEDSEDDSRRRFVALEALIRRAGQGGEDSKAVSAALARVAQAGPPLARLAARVGAAFLGQPVESLRGFLDRLLGA